MQFLYSGLTAGSIYALVALGFNIIYNTTGLINFAQGEFVMIGGMLMYTLFAVLGMPFYIAFPLAILAALVLGMVFERFFINLVRVKNDINLITVTIAASIILRDFAMHMWGRDTVNVGEYVPVKSIQLPGGVISTQSLMVIGFGAVIALALHFFLKKSKYGRAMRACFDDMTAAGICGINAVKVRVMSFGVAAAVGAAAGVLISPITFVTYDDGVMIGLKGFAAAILGGLGSFWGAIAGGILLGVLEGFSATILPSGYKDAVAFVVILLILFVKPAGLFGKRMAKRV
jgi:branched-chain amino acid transport system permease protein